MEHSLGANTTWEADIVLADGGIAVLRPILPTDRENLLQFYAGVSAESKYLRFFNSHPELTTAELEQWLNSDGHSQVHLALVYRSQIIAVAGYQVITHGGSDQHSSERIGDVAFLVQDAHHGRGVANILLEHLAQIGREHNIDRFCAQMLPHNRAMKEVFRRAGYSVRPELSDGFITVDFTIAATADSREVMLRRELRAEANSIRQILQPLPSPPAIGTQVGLFSADPNVVGIQKAEHRTQQLHRAIDSATEHNAAAIIFPAQGTSPQMSSEEAGAIVAYARAAGLRILGPASLGVINTAAEHRLNTTPAPMPRAGTVGIFTQSSGVAALTLSLAIAHNCGISSFLAAGAFADITANDMMQYWSTDDATQICLLSLDRIGNPRNFFRVLRRLALSKHVVVFNPGRAVTATDDAAEDPTPDSAEDPAPASAEAAKADSTEYFDQVVRQTGAMVVARRDVMFAITHILARQPLIAGRRVAVVSNSAGLVQHMTSAARRFQLAPAACVTPEDAPALLVDEVSRALDSSDVDAVVVAVVEIGTCHQQIRESLERIAAETNKPLVANFVGFSQANDTATTTPPSSLSPPSSSPSTPSSSSDEQPEAMGQLPVVSTYADGLEALSHIYASQHRRQAVLPLETSGSPESQILASPAEGRVASAEETARVLAHYGIDVLPSYPASHVAEALRAADQLGWDVVVRATNPAVRSRPDLVPVTRHIHNHAELHHAWETLATMGAEHGMSINQLAPIVQKTVSPGPTLTIRAFEDTKLGPIINVGISGIASDVLGDVQWAVPPLSLADAREVYDRLRAAPILRSAHRASLETLLVAVAKLKDEHPEISQLVLSPVISSQQRTVVAGAHLSITPPHQRDPGARALTTHIREQT